MTSYPFRPRFGEPLWGPGSQWTRRLRDEQITKQIAAAELRIIDRLGPDWHVVDWQKLRPPVFEPKTVLPGFLVIGPGGLFSVDLVSHGRSRVLMAGDVVQINGQRPSYVHMARRDADYTANALSNSIGYQIAVFAVLAFVGRGTISVNGLPKGCIISTYRELHEVLAATGQRITPSTAQKLAQVARNATTWAVNPDTGTDETA